MKKREVLYSDLRDYQLFVKRSYPSLARLLLGFVVIQELIIGFMVFCNSGVFYPCLVSCNFSNYIL